MLSRFADRFLSSGILLILTVGFVVFFSLYDTHFWSVNNLVNVIRNASYLMIVSAGQMMVLIIGGFDLSVGAVVALASVAGALTMVQVGTADPGASALAIGAGCVAALSAGAVIGAINGLTVSLLEVNPFMVTLGTMSAAAGIGLYVTGGVPIYGMPDAFVRDFGRGMRWLGLPMPVFVTAGILMIIWLVMNRTRFGRYVYAIGSNKNAARVSGVPVAFYTTVTYIVCSLLAAAGGVMLTARVGSGEATLGANLMLESITAAVIGGVSLRGGVGRVELVALGSLLLALVTNGVNLARIDSKTQSIIIGIILLFVAGLDSAVAAGRRR
jgi:ribose transport system permease protein